MWPPSSDDVLLAFRTVAIAFQRTIDRTRRSSASSTGCGGSSCGGIVFRYGVVPAGAGAAPVSWACPTTRSSKNCARCAPSLATTASSASSHSRVSWGSTSTWDAITAPVLCCGVSRYDTRFRSVPWHAVLREHLAPLHGGAPAGALRRRAERRTERRRALVAARRGPRRAGRGGGRHGGRADELRRGRHAGGRPGAAQRPGAPGRVPGQRAGGVGAGGADERPALQRAGRVRGPRARAGERGVGGRRGGRARRRGDDRGRQHVRERALPPAHDAGGRGVRPLGRPRQRPPPVRRVPHAAHGGEPHADDRGAPRPDRPHPDRRRARARRAGHGRDRLPVRAAAHRRARLRRLDRPRVQAHAPDRRVARLAGKLTRMDVLRRAEELAAFTEEPGRITRPLGSPSLAGAMGRVREWMGAAGLETRSHPLGNLAGRRRSGPIVIGSHLDTGAVAGRYDGVLGVLAGIAVAEALPDAPLEVVAFADEDGLRFHSSFLGSRAYLGRLTPEDFALRDADGGSLAEAIGAAEQWPALAPDGIRAYLEVHIEQGPVLDAEGLPL